MWVRGGSVPERLWVMALFGPKAPATYKGTSSKAIRHHYDFLGDFYRLFLGPGLVYSYGAWRDGHDSGGDGGGRGAGGGAGGGDTLEAAQLRKLDDLAVAGGAVGARRVLDVGCGWGGLLHRLVEAHGVERAVGLTMSPGQAEWVRRQGWERCEVRAENWFDHVPDAPYDSIIAIEAIEHFAGSTLWRSRRVDRYRAFFERCHSWLRPGGGLALQCNAWNDRGWLASMVLPASVLAASNGGSARLRLKDLYGGLQNVRDNVRDGLHASRKVFPECFLPTRAELIEAGRGLFQVREARNDPQDGVRTVECWLERALANEEHGAALIGATAVSDIIREQRATLKLMREHRSTVLRMAFERV